MYLFFIIKNKHFQSSSSMMKASNAFLLCSHSYSESESDSVSLRVIFETAIPNSSSVNKVLSLHCHRKYVGQSLGRDR